METLSFNKKSWHYRLATTYNNYDRRVPDLCSYMRAVLFGGVSASLLTMALMTVAVSFESVIIWIIVSLQTGIWVKPDEITIVAFAVIGLAILIAVIGTCVGAFFKTKEVLEERRAQGKTDPFVLSAIKSLSNKFCKRVEFV